MLTVAILLTAFAPTLVSKRPVWVPDMLSGYTVGPGKEGGGFGVLDSESGYYFSRSIECDSSHVSLILTKDRKIMTTTYGVDIPSYPNDRGAEGWKLTKKPLRNLGTNKGVEIGMTLGEVEAKIGKPKVRKTDSRFTRWTYEWRNVKNGEGHIFEQHLAFKKGKLIEIIVNREAVPGC